MSTSSEEKRVLVGSFRPSEYRANHSLCNHRCRRCRGDPLPHLQGRPGIHRTLLLSTLQWLLPFDLQADLLSHDEPVPLCDAPSGEKGLRQHQFEYW